VGRKVKKLQIGDLVKITEETHDDRMPDNRTGLIIEVERSVYKVWMTNGETLKFHEMFLERVE